MGTRKSLYSGFEIRRGRIRNCQMLLKVGIPEETRRLEFVAMDREHSHIFYQKSGTKTLSILITRPDDLTFTYHPDSFGSGQAGECLLIRGTTELGVPFRISVPGKFLREKMLPSLDSPGAFLQEVFRVRNAHTFTDLSKGVVRPTVTDTLVFEASQLEALRKAMLGR